MEDGGTDFIGWWWLSLLGSGIDEALFLVGAGTGFGVDRVPFVVCVAILDCSRTDDAVAWKPLHLNLPVKAVPSLFLTKKGDSR